MAEQRYAQKQTLEGIIADVDREFVGRHPDFREQKLNQSEEQEPLRDEWNAMFYARTMQVLKGIRDQGAGAERLAPLE